jgi:hypothetical protein
VQQDTTLEVAAGALQRARISRDPQGGLHVVFERSVNGVAQVRYRRCRPDGRWDASSTDVSDLASGDAIRPCALPSAPGDVTVIYTNYSGGVSRFMERLRTSDQPPATAVDDYVPPPPAAFRGVVYPNPARVGMAVETRWSAAEAGPGPGTLDVFDLLGRRVASLPLVSDGAWLRARIGADATRRWAPGIYLVRPRQTGATAQRLVVLR